MKQRYYVEILDTGVYVKDSYLRTGNRIVRQWPPAYRFEICPLCGHQIGRAQVRDHDAVRQAVELCQKLNHDYVKERGRQLRSQAAVTMGANNVNWEI
jgi:hypothetical protein